MPSLFTLQDLDETLNNLALTPGTLKAELAMAVRSYFADEQSLQAIPGIPTEEIIFKLWGVCQNDELKARRKNFSSLKSALNKSLKDLDKEGKNQTGIILGRNNIFIISEERKDDLIRQLGLSPNAPHLLRDMFAAFKDFLSENIKDQNIQEIKELLAEFAEAQKELRKIAGLAPESGQEENSAETAEAGGGTTPGAGAEIGPSKKESNKAVEFLDEEVKIIAAGALAEGPEAGTASGGGLGAEEGGGGAEAEPVEEMEVIDEELVEEIVVEDSEDTELREEAGESLAAGALAEGPKQEAASGEGLGAEGGGGGAEAEPVEEMEVIDEELVEEIVVEDSEDTELREEAGESLAAGALTEGPKQEAASGEGWGAEEGGGAAEAEPVEEMAVIDEELVEEIEEIEAEDSEDTELLEEEELEIPAFIRKKMK